MAGGFGVASALRLVSNLILARLLFPEAFGLMAVIAAVLYGLEMLSDAGLHGSVMYHDRGMEPRFLNTVWTVQVMRGFGLWFAACLLAWPLSVFLGESQLGATLPVAGMGIAIRGFASATIYTLSRRLMVARLTMFRLGIQTFGMLVTLALALLQPSVWALVGGILATHMANAVGSHLVFPGRPHRFCWERSARQSLFRYGKWVLLSSASTFMARQLDRLVLAKLATMSTLGVYSLALVFAAIPRTVVDQLGMSVLQPAFAESTRRGPGFFAGAFFRAREPVLLAGLLMALVIAIASPLFFEAFYDTRYADATWLGQLLAVHVWISVLDVPTSKALLGQGHSRAEAAGNLAGSIVSVIGSIVGYHYSGLGGFVIGAVGGATIGHVVKVLQMGSLRRRILTSDARYCLLFAIPYAAAVFGPSVVGHGSALAHIGWGLVSLIPPTLVAVPAMIALRGSRGAVPCPSH